jgi:hypothetical protein
MGKFYSRIAASVAFAVTLTACSQAVGQQAEPQQPAPAQTAPAPAPLPDAPAPAQSTSTSGANTDAVKEDQHQEKRIMGLLPNFRSVSAGTTPPQETVKDKFLTATEDNFDYSSLFFAGLIAGFSFSTKSTPEFHQGAAGYGRYYWHAVADQAVENYFVEFIFPEVTHQDSRYFAMGASHNRWKRAGYAISRVVVTRTDSGKSTFNISEIGGAAAATAVSNFYYPTKEQTVGNAVRNWGLDISYDALAFAFHEFSPDLRQLFLRKKDAAAGSTP